MLIDKRAERLSPYKIPRFSRGFWFCIYKLDLLCMVIKKVLILVCRKGGHMDSSFPRIKPLFESEMDLNHSQCPFCEPTDILVSGVRTGRFPKRFKVNWPISSDLPPCWLLFLRH